MNIMRESIFSSAVRSFFNALLAMIGVIIGLFILMGLVTFASKPYDIQNKVQVTILADDQGNDRHLSEQSPVLLQIDIHNVIGSDQFTANDLPTILTASRQGSFKNGRVKGILLNIDSPGGDAVESDNIYRALMEYREKYQVPVYAFVDGLCASGGMYIACSAEKIYSTPVSIIGSVGVIQGPRFNFYEFMQNHGFQAKVMTEGFDKAPFLPFTKWPEGEAAKAAEEPLRNIIQFYYNRFVSIVVKARQGLTKEDLIQTYGARVFIAEDAEKYHYIDGADATRESTLKALAKAANIEENTPYQCVKLATPSPLLQGFLGGQCSLFKGTWLENVFKASNASKDPYHKFYYIAEL